MIADIINVYIIGAAETLMQLWFSRSFLKSEIKPLHYVPLAVISCILINIIPAGDLSKSLIFVLLLFMIGAVCMKADKKSAAVCAVTSAVIMQLSFGVFACLTSLLSGLTYNPVLWITVSLIGSICPLIVSYFCYKAIMLKMPAYKIIKNNPIAVIFPLILIFGLDLYIKNNIYGSTVLLHNIPTADVHIEFLIVRILCLASVMCIIWSYNKLLESQVAELEYQLKLQYTEQSKALYKKTTSFRHDFKNHLMVISGLIDKQEYANAKKYADELYGQSGEMSFAYSTGRPVLDILLEEKLSGLQNIRVNSDIKIPEDFEISDIDLCIITSNAVDNAVNACNNIGGNRYIEISCKRSADMLLFEFENSFDGKPFSESVGLFNIRTAVKKYNGTVMINTNGSVFALKLLFNIR